MSIDREYSTGAVWDNSIDLDDASDGSEGGYDRHGNFIIANAMTELVQLRIKVALQQEALEKARDVLEFMRRKSVGNSWGWDVTTLGEALAAIDAIGEKP